MVLPVVSIRLEKSDIDWLTEFAVINNFIHNGKGNVSKAVTYLIRLEQERERSKGSTSIVDDLRWRLYPEYHDLREKGYSFSDASREAGLLSKDPAIAKAYEERYVDMKLMERGTEEKIIFSFLGPHLRPVTKKYLRRFTSDPMPWIAKAVVERVNFQKETFQYWLENPKDRPHNVSEEGLREFLK